MAFETSNQVFFSAPHAVATRLDSPPTYIMSKRKRPAEDDNENDEDEAQEELNRQLDDEEDKELERRLSQKRSAESERLG